MRVSRMPTGEPEIFASVQGEGVTCGLPSVFVRLGLCNLKCTYCWLPETPVLMADWSWKALGDVVIGDQVMAVERSRPAAHLGLVPAIVTRVLVRDAATVWVNETFRCTPDHRLWIAGRNAEGVLTHRGWRRVDGALWDQALFTTEPVANAIGHHPGGLRTIRSVEPSDRVEPVVDLTTTAGSFVAGGFVVKNCDTPYTWDWRRYDPKQEMVGLDVEEVAHRVAERAGNTIRNVVLTGGEPLLQARELAALASRLRAEGFRIEVETNGTVRPNDELTRAVDQWNVSPKLESSGNLAARREVPEALAWFAHHADAYWKFVVISPEDLPEIDDFVERYRVPEKRVILMPEGTDPETLSERSRWLSEACQERGYRLGTRLHVYLWGATRGR